MQEVKRLLSHLVSVIRLSCLGLMCSCVFQLSVVWLLVDVIWALCCFCSGLSWPLLLTELRCFVVDWPVRSDWRQTESSSGMNKAVWNAQLLESNSAILYIVYYIVYYIINVFYFSSLKLQPHTARYCSRRHKYHPKIQMKNIKCHCWVVILCVVCSCSCYLMCADVVLTWFIKSFYRSIWQQSLLIVNPKLLTRRTGRNLLQLKDISEDLVVKLLMIHVNAFNGTLTQSAPNSEMQSCCFAATLQRQQKGHQRKLMTSRQGWQQKGAHRSLGNWKWHYAFTQSCKTTWICQKCHYNVCNFSKWIKDISLI